MRQSQVQDGSGSSLVVWNRGSQQLIGEDGCEVEGESVGVFEVVEYEGFDVSHCLSIVVLVGEVKLQVDLCDVCVKKLVAHGLQHRLSI